MTDKKSPQQDSEKENKMTEQADGVSYVSLVSDPFGLRNNEIAEAQETMEPLTLDEPMDEVDAELADLDNAPVTESLADAAAIEASAESLSHSEDEGEDSSQEESTEVSEISMADLRKQAEDEALEEDSLEEFVPAEDNGTLDRLAGAIHEENEKNRVEAEELVARAAEALADWTPDAEAQAALESANQLAAQIAEDQALQEQLAKEAEEAEKVDPELAAALPQVSEDGSLDLNELQSCIEAILFMTDKPMGLERIRELIGAEFELNLYQEAMTALMDRYKSTAHGMELAQVANGYQFRTKPGRAALAKKLAKVQTQRLSSGAMESLAIVAYRQPVLKDEIDKIRGVDSSYFIRQLLDKKLIQISGRSEEVGRPLLYSTTDEFLSLFNLKDLAAMPSLREIEQMIPASQSQNPEDEDPRVKEMRKLVSQMKSDTSVQLIYDAREDDKILQDIKDKVNSIQTSTPYLDQQKEIERMTAEATKAGMTLEEWGAAQAALAAAKEADKEAARAAKEAEKEAEKAARAAEREAARAAKKAGKASANAEAESAQDPAHEGTGTAVEGEELPHTQMSPEMLGDLPPADQNLDPTP